MVKLLRFTGYALLNGKRREVGGREGEGDAETEYDVGSRGAAEVAEGGRWTSLFSVFVRYRFGS